MKLYYAHSMHIYNTPQEARDVALLEKLGFEVLNPNNAEIQGAIDEYKAAHGQEKVMEYFHSMIDGCDGVAYRAHADLKIPSGVGYEVKYAKDKDMPVFELPTLTKARMLDYEETKTYLELNGQR